MTDIVGRLRDWSEFDEGKINDAREEAAAEIERLRAALEEIKSLGVQKKGSASYAMASIARTALAQGGDK